MSNQAIKQRIQQDWTKICKNAVWFKGGIQPMLNLGLQGCLNNLQDAGLIDRWSVDYVDVDHNGFEVSDQYRLETSILKVYAKVSYRRSSLDNTIQEVTLAFDATDKRPLGSKRRKPKNRWDMIAEEMQGELPFDEEKLEPKDRPDPGVHKLPKDVSP